MTTMVTTMAYGDVLARAAALADRGERAGRVLLGLTGGPGAGKSTLAERLVQDLPGRAVLVPMDGFHLANAELLRLGRRDRKGAPDTFDAGGYVALLRRLRDPAEDLVYAPRFDRTLEEPVAGAVAVPAHVPLVVTEGNYLLLSAGPWAAVRGLLDEAWFLAPAESVRLDRLITRHIAFGKSPQQAREWSLGTDQRNAELVAATRSAADLVLTWC